MIRVPVTAAAVLAPFLFAAAPAPAQRAPTTELLKREVTAEVAGLQKLSQEMVDMVFSLAELGFEEHRTVAYLTGVLEKEGFRIDRGCAAMPTCYVARWGSGRP